MLASLRRRVFLRGQVLTSSHRFVLLIIFWGCLLAVLLLQLVLGIGGGSALVFSEFSVLRL